MAQSWTQQKIQSLKLVSIREDLPTCGDLVRVSLERMCITQSDFSSYALGGLGRAKMAAPHILGAAACCRVVDPGQSKLKIGDLVVPSPIKGEIAPNGEVHFNASRPDSAYAGIPPQPGFCASRFS